MASLCSGEDEAGNTNRAPRWLALALSLAFLLSFAASPPVAGAGPTPNPNGWLEGANAHMGRVCSRDSAGVVLNQTLAATDNVPSDVQLGGDGVGGASRTVYFGLYNPSGGYEVMVGTAGVGGAVIWSYWNGVKWAGLKHVVDATDDFTKPGQNRIEFPPPADWATTVIDSVACPDYLYYVAITTGAAYTTPPFASKISGLDYNLKLKVQDELGQPLSGLQTWDIVYSTGTTPRVLRVHEVTPGIFLVAVAFPGGSYGVTVQVQKDGYVRSDRVVGSGAPPRMTDLTSRPAVLPFAVRVVLGGQESLGTAVTGATVTVGSEPGRPCRESPALDGSYFCAVPLRDTVADIVAVHPKMGRKVVRDAFVDRDENTDRQVVAPERVVRLGSALPFPLQNTAYAWDGSYLYLFGGLTTDGVRTNKILRYHPTSERVTVMSAVLPSALDGASAVWTGTHFYIFGGNNGSRLKQILRYDPEVDEVKVMANKLPLTRDSTSAVWDGRYAYIFGGLGVTGPADTIYRYDPANDRPTVTNATLPSGRSRTAAVWTGEAAYIIGGWDGLHLNQIVRYVPSSGEVRVMNSTLGSARESLGAVFTGRQVLMIGGWTGTLGSASIERFDPENDTVAFDSATLPEPVEQHAVAWDGSKVIIAGGQRDGAPSARILRYAPANAQVTGTTALPSARMTAPAVWTGSQVFVIGGKDQTKHFDEIFQFDPATRSAGVAGARLPSPRGASSAVWTGSHIYVFGGSDGNRMFADVLQYNPSTGEIRLMNATLPQGRTETSAIWDGRHAYIFGGWLEGSAAYGNDILRYDPVTDTMTPMAAQLPSRYGYSTAVWTGSEAFLFGGYPFTDKIVKFEPSADRVTVMQSVLPTKRYWVSAAWDGRQVYMFGGTGLGQEVGPEILRYRPDLDALAVMTAASATDRLPTARYGSTAVAAGEMIYIFGGYTHDPYSYLSDILAYNSRLGFGFVNVDELPPPPPPVENDDETGGSDGGADGSNQGADGGSGSGGTGTGGRGDRDYGLGYDPGGGWIDPARQVEGRSSGIAQGIVAGDGTGGQAGGNGSQYRVDVELIPGQSGGNQPQADGGSSWKPSARPARGKQGGATPGLDWLAGLGVAATVAVLAFRSPREP